MYGFKEPEIIKSEVFVELPREYQKSPPQRTALLNQSPTGTTLEGPSFDLQGNLYFTDIPNGRIFRASPEGKVELAAEYDGEPNGLKIHKDGRIFIADHRHGLMLMDAKKGTVTPLLKGPHKEGFKGVNDLIFASNGDLYFTDQGATGLHDPTGRVYRMTPSGQLTILIDTIPSPNGIELDLKESGIFIAVTRAAAIWYVPMASTGTLYKAGIHARLPTSGPDGIALDIKGNLAVSHPGLGVAWLFGNGGFPIARVDSCTGRHVANLAYGGPDNQWLYMCEGDSFSILRAKMPYPGRKMFSHA